jgi:biopolymer transport protein ExbD
METKGTTQRLIETPGYHIKPKYDLPYWRTRKESGEERDFDAVLTLTSMIDMFSMLVVFLIMNFSSTGEAYFVSKDITLPEAATGRPLESLPLVSITKDQVSLDSNLVGATPASMAMDEDLPQLRAALQRLRQLQGNLAAAGIKSKTQVNVQADQKTPVMYVKRVMNVLISEEFTRINFAVREPSKE